MNNVKLVTENGKVYATSRQVAKDFGKEHKHVLNNVREIIKNLADENSATNYFIKSTYKNRGKDYPEFKLTKDGFTLLAMGFTGAKALQFKIDYINKFNEMEEKLKDIDNVMNTKGNMSLEDYNKIRFSEKRTINTFTNSNVDDVKQLVKEFKDYVINLDTKTRVARCKSSIKGLQRLHDKVAKESTLNIAECYKILQYIDKIKKIKHEAENRNRGQKIGHRNRKINELTNELEKACPTRS